MLDIDPCSNPVHYQGKLLMQTWENGENPDFGPILVAKIFFREFYLY